MRALAMLALPLALYACGSHRPAGDPPAETPGLTAPPASSAPAGSNEATAASIALPGEYRVAGVDGADVDQPYAITASITANSIHVTADCLNFAWDYAARGQTISTERVAVEGCARGLTAAEEAVVAAFDSVTTAVRTPANAIELNGSGHSVTLFSQ